jgi:retron-type reverse transcriptase
MVRPLAAILSRAHFRAASGHKFDRQYHTYTLPKRSGGTRKVSAPSSLLKSAQRSILKHVLTPLGAHSSAYGFVPERSIALNAQQHVGKQVVANCDIQDCFPSVTWQLVLGVLRRDLGKIFSPAAISIVVDLSTAAGVLPIGAPTSPALLNRVLYRTDEILTAAAEARGCTYSRYADDMTFSGDSSAVGLLGIARRTLGQIGLELDPKKNNIYRRGRRQIVTGLVVNTRVSVPRRLRRRLRAAVHAVDRGGVATWHGKPIGDQSLLGRLAHCESVNPERTAPLMRRYRRVRDKSGA